MRPLTTLLLWVVCGWSVCLCAEWRAQRATPELKEWFFLGPFTIGKTEVDGDPLEAFGGIETLSPSKNASVKFISELVDGGLVGWEKLKRDGRDGFVDVSPSANWQTLYNALNSIAVLEFQGWAISYFTTSNAENYLLTCTGVHNIEIDEREIFYHGDIYSRDIPVLVSLSAGKHVIRLRIRARAQTRFKCEFEPVTAPFSLHPAKFAPDVHNGEFWGGSAWLSVGIQNHHSETWLRNLMLSISSDTVELVESSIDEYSIAPGGMMLVNFRIKLREEQSKSEQDDCVKFRVNIRQSEASDSILGDEYEVTLRCRRKDQSFMFTFLDHDNTVSHAAAIRPWNQCKTPCPVILTLSGVGVPPQNQADSYKYAKKSKSKKDEWYFGMKDMWVLAPERGGAHNWEGTGYQTAITSLQRLVELTRDSLYPADPDRLLYAGHSRGGHGSWMLATLFSASGWTNREYYGDANIIFEHDLNNLHMDNFVRHILLSTIAENDVALSAENLKNVPVMARVGTADRSVPAWHMRRYARLLKEVGANVSWAEYEGKDHWWWDTATTNDGGVVFDADVRHFFNYFHSPHVPAFIDEKLEVISLNPATFYGRGGFRILQFTTPYRKSRLLVDSIDEKLYIKTTNVKRFQLYEVKGARNSSSIPRNGILVDTTHFAQETALSLYQPGHHLCATESKVWQICTDGDSYQKKERGPSNYGPARQVFSRPTAIVIPQQESVSKTDYDFFLRVALYISYSHYFAVGSRVPVLTDLDALQAGSTTNFVLLGGEANQLLARLNNAGDVKLPVSLEKDGSIRFGEQCTFKKDSEGVGIVYTMPSWDENAKQSRLHLVVHGTSHKGIANVAKFSFASNQALTRAAYTNMMPDFFITGKDFRWKGYGGLHAIGFWGNSWELRNDISYLDCPTRPDE